MLKKIGSTARKELELELETKVNLQIWVKVRKEWRDNMTQMVNFCYNPKEQ
jgi:GTP-binding protein Era